MVPACGSWGHWFQSQEILFHLLPQNYTSDKKFGYWIGKKHFSSKHISEYLKVGQWIGLVVWTRSPRWPGLLIPRKRVYLPPTCGQKLWYSMKYNPFTKSVITWKAAFFVRQCNLRLPFTVSGRLSWQDWNLTVTLVSPNIRRQICIRTHTSDFLCLTVLSFGISANQSRWTVF